MIKFVYATGQSLYVRFDNGSNTAINMTEGSSLNTGRYTVSDAAIVSAGVAAGVYQVRIFIGTAGAQAAGDVLVAVGDIDWNGTSENGSGSILASITTLLQRLLKATLDR